MIYKAPTSIKNQGANTQLNLQHLSNKLLIHFTNLIAVLQVDLSLLCNYMAGVSST